MKNKKIFRTFAALCTCLVLMGGFSVTAFAQGADPAPTATPAADATNDSNVVVEETEDTPPLTPEGNAALVDDYGGNKQLIPGVGGPPAVPRLPGGRAHRAGPVPQGEAGPGAGDPRGGLVEAFHRESVEARGEAPRKGFGGKRQIGLVPLQ